MTPELLRRIAFTLIALLVFRIGHIRPVAGYFIAIYLIPELLLYTAGLPFYLDGTSLLIVV
jgi:preprotein translocase subunit SecY